MAKSLYIPSRHLVEATETTPAGFRPGNQANLVPTRATNPQFAHTDALAFLPATGECRSGNGHSDLGLGGKWLHRGQLAVSGLGRAPDVSFNAPTPMAIQLAKQHGVDPAQVQAIIEQETKAAQKGLINVGGLWYKPGELKSRGITISMGKAYLNGKWITLEELANSQLPKLYKDAAGNTISEAEYNRLNELAKNPRPVAPPPVTSQRKVVKTVKPLPKGIGKTYFPAPKPPGMKGLGALTSGNSMTFILGLAGIYGLYLLTKQK